MPADEHEPSRGEFTGVVNPATVTEEQLGLLMVGESLDDDAVDHVALDEEVSA